jgi:hypothetical protein
VKLNSLGFGVGAVQAIIECILAIVSDMGRHVQAWHVRWKKIARNPHDVRRILRIGKANAMCGRILFSYGDSEDAVTGGYIEGPRSRGAEIAKRNRLTPALARLSRRDIRPGQAQPQPQQQ